MLLGGAVLAPLAIPLLPPETYIRYTKAIGLQQPAIENAPAGTAAADFRGSVRMGRDGGDGGACLQQLAAGGSRAHRDLRADLWTGGSHRSVRSQVRVAAGHQRASELFSLGTAGLHGREHDRDGRQPGGLWSGCSPACKKSRTCDHPYSMPYQHFDVYYCQGMHPPLAELGRVS